MGGRDSPRPNVVAPGDETWTTVGRGLRNVSVDPKKLQNIKVIYLSHYTKHNSTSVSLLLFYIQYYIYLFFSWLVSGRNSLIPAI